MALEQLLSVLAREADTESASVLAAARAEAQAIRDQAESALAKRREEEARIWEGERQRAMTVTLAGARRQARQEELLARDRLLARVMALAREQLPAQVERPEFRAALPVMLDGAIECLGNRAGTIRSSPLLLNEIGRHTNGSKQIALQPDASVETGFQLTSADGSLLIDATLAHQAEQLGLQLRQEILARLEGAP